MRRIHSKRESGQPKKKKLRSTTTSLLSCSNEILLIIAENIEFSSDINSLLKTNRRLAMLLTSHLHNLGLNLSRQRFWPFARETILHWAAKRGDEKLTRQLLIKGASIKTRDHFGSTALHRAAQKGHSGVVELFMREKDADQVVDTLDATGYNALHWAAVNGHVGVVTVLLKEGVNIAAVTKSEATAIELAYRMEHGAVVKLLKDGSVSGG